MALHSVNNTIITSFLYVETEQCDVARILTLIKTIISTYADNQEVATSCCSMLYRLAEFECINISNGYFIN